MTDTTNHTPTGSEEARLALAFARIDGDEGDVVTSWIGPYDYEDQFDAMRIVARQRNMEVVQWTGVNTRNIHLDDFLPDLIDFLKEHHIDVLLVATKRHLAQFWDSEPPYFWEQKLADAGIEIVEAPPEELL